MDMKIFMRLIECGEQTKNILNKKIMILFNRKIFIEKISSKKSITQRIKNASLLRKEKVIFLKALCRPDLYDYSFFDEKWSMYEKNIKKDLIRIYNNNKISAYANLIKKENNNLLLDLMLSNGFCLNKKDLKKFKKNSWFKYTHFYNKQQETTQSKFYQYPIVIFNKIKKLTLKQKPYLSLSNTFNIKTNDILVKHFNKLPVDLQKQVIKSATTEQLLIIYEQDIPVYI